MQDELVERVARQIAPSAWLSFDARCKRKGFAPEEIPGELAEWLADHPHGAMAASLAKARAIIRIVQADQRAQSNGLVAKNAALEVAYEELLAQHRAAIRKEQTDG